MASSTVQEEGVTLSHLSLDTSNICPSYTTLLQCSHTHGTLHKRQGCQAKGAGTVETKT
jgi:hypothetical protein